MSCADSVLKKSIVNDQRFGGGGKFAYEHNFIKDKMTDSVN